jgi:hypothetical protein
MAFTILANGNPTDAQEINNNFYHIASGSRIPMGGVSLAATTLAYDLGTTTAYWNNLFVNNIYANSITTANKSLWTLVSEVTLTATASSIEFTGLNGDTAIEYNILAYIDCPNAGYADLYLNNDSATANYGNQMLVGQSTTVSAIRNIIASGWRLGNFYDGLTGFGVLNLKSKTNGLRMGICNFMNITSTVVQIIFNYAYVWNNTTSTVSSLKIVNPVNYFNPNTHIEIWSRK